MGLSERYLGDDENVVLETRKSRFLLVRPLLSALLLALVALVATVLPVPGSVQRGTDYLAGAIVLAALVRLGLALLGWSMNQIVVSDHRIFEVSGVVNRKVASMPLDKLNDLTYRRGLLGRLFGFGDFLVESAGEREGLDRLEMIPSPDHFYRTVTSVVAHGAPKRTDDEPRDPDDEDTGPIPRIIV